MLDIIKEILYNRIMEREVRTMKRRKRIPPKDLAELIIKAVIALASLITAIASLRR